MKRTHLFINSFSQMTQIISISIIYFLLYRFLLNSIGPKLFGIWALITSIANIPSIINLGLSGSVIKYVAKYIALKDEQKVSSLIQTATISIGIIIAFFSLFIYLIVKKVLYLIIPEEFMGISFFLLLFALICFWVRNISNIFQSALDAYQCFYLRNIVWIISSLINLILCIILVPVYSVKGVAYSLLIQNIILMLGNYVFLKKLLPILPVVLFKWEKNILREIITYGLSLQINSIIYTFFDPFIKVLISKYGNIGMVSYYEMANKMVGQVKMIIISVIQIIVPVISNLKEKMPQRITYVYSRTYQIILYVSLIVFSILIIISPLISKIWIGQYEKNFVIFSVLLSIGYMIWTIIYPAEAVCLGVGKLKFIIIGNATIALLSVSMGYLLGTLYNGIGVIIAFTVSLIIGSIIKYISFHYTQKIKIEFVPKQIIPLFIMWVIGTLFAGINIYFQKSFQELPKMTIFNIVIFGIIIFLVSWFNIMKKEIYMLIKKELMNLRERV